MVWNPSPKVAIARDTAKKFDASMIAIITVGKEGVRLTTFGKNKELCSEAKTFGDVAFEAVMDLFNGTE